MKTETSEEQSPTSTIKKKKKTPKWLKALEAQSWQAELLISGLVIASLLQMPEALLQWGEHYVIESSELGYGFFILALLYIYAALYTLIIFFAIFTPVIPSDVVKGSVLKVFIPTIEREKNHMNFTKRSFMQKLRGSDALRDSVRQVNLYALRDFNSIFINDESYPEPDILYYTHPNANEPGVLVHLPTNSFSVGKNVLEIRKNYYSKDSIQKIVRIPFYFEPFGRSQSSEIGDE